MTALAQKPLVYLITDGTATNETYQADRRRILDIIATAIAAKVTLIQVREKHLSGRLLFDLAKGAASLTKGTETRLLINDRADIALASGADGVHLATTSLPAGAVRRHFPRPFIIGVSTHSAEEIRRAADDAADLVVFGPVFSTPGKEMPLGLEALNEVAEEFRPFPIIGLGGVNAANWRSVIKAGAAGFAAIRSLNDAASMREIMRAVRDE